MTFIGLWPHRASPLPGVSAIIAIDDMRKVLFRAGYFMVAGNQQAPTAQLNADSRAGGVPRPIRRFDLCRNVAGFGPRRAVVIAVSAPNTTCPSAGAFNNGL